jgi:putative tricarboxylic transport membrane protein
MRFNDAVIGAVLLALALAMMAYTRGFPPMPGQNYGPALFPVLIGIGLSVCAVLLIGKGWRQRRQVPWLALDPWVREPRRIGGVALMLAGILAYILLSDVLGFLITATALLGILLVFSGVRWQRAVPIAVLMSVFVHLSFYSLLRVPLPWGVLTPIAW